MEEALDTMIIRLDIMVVPEVAVEQVVEMRGGCLFSQVILIPLL